MGMEKGWALLNDRRVKDVTGFVDERYEEETAEIDKSGFDSDDIAAIHFAKRYNSYSITENYELGSIIKKNENEKWEGVLEI